MNIGWIVLATLVAFSYGAYNFYIKLSSSYIHQITGAVILQSSALVAGLIALAFLKLKDYPLPVTRQGVQYAMAAGVFVGLAEVLSFYYFSFGVNVSQGTPAIVGGSVVASVLLSLIFLREKLGVGHYLGIAFIVTGIVLLTMKSESN